MQFHCFQALLFPFGAISTDFSRRRLCSGICNSDILHTYLHGSWIVAALFHFELLELCSYIVFWLCYLHFGAIFTDFSCNLLELRLENLPAVAGSSFLRCHIFMEPSWRLQTSMQMRFKCFSGIQCMFQIS